MTDVLTTRSLQTGDAGAVLDVLAAAERAEPVDEAFSEQDVLEELTAPGVDLDRGSVEVLDGSRLVGFGLVTFNDPATVWRAYLWGSVHPEYGRRGIGTRVLRRLADGAARIRDEDARGRPGELKVWVDEGRRGTAAVTAAAGYETWRYFFRMRATLGRDRPPVADPEGVTIRRYTPDDEEAVRLLSNASFADHWGSSAQDPDRWRASYADSESFRPQHSWLAEIDGTVVGFVHVVEYEAETTARGHRTGYLSRVGTARAARGRGVATALMSRTLEDLAAHGYPFADLDVDADSPTGAGRLYERAGFAVVSRSRVVGRRF